MGCCFWRICSRVSPCYSREMDAPPPQGKYLSSGFSGGMDRDWVILVVTRSNWPGAWLGQILALSLSFSDRWIVRVKHAPHPIHSKAAKALIKIWVTSTRRGMLSRSAGGFPQGFPYVAMAWRNQDIEIHLAAEIHDGKSAHMRGDRSRGWSERAHEPASLKPLGSWVGPSTYVEGAKGTLHWWGEKLRNNLTEKFDRKIFKEIDGKIRRKIFFNLTVFLGSDGFVVESSFRQSFLKICTIKYFCRIYFLCFEKKIFSFNFLQTFPSPMFLPLSVFYILTRGMIVKLSDLINKLMSVGFCILMPSWNFVACLKAHRIWGQLLLNRPCYTLP